MNEIESYDSILPKEPEIVIGNEKNTRPDCDNATIERLSKLSLLEYDRVRVSEAKSLGIRPQVLDKEVANKRKGKQSNASIDFDDVESWPDPVNPADLLDTVEATIRRFIVCNSETAIAATLWIVMTWFMDVVHFAPLAIITAPEKRCGKSQLLFLMGKMVKKPLLASGISPAALFRSIEKWNPTLMIDEADAFMKENEEIRLLLNSAHTRNAAFIIRSVGDNHDPTRFNTWGPKVVCGISAHKLAETITDRAVLLELRRKLDHESVERLRYAPPELFDELTAKLARFSDDCQDTIRSSRPHLPEKLNDRAQDNWEPLLAIADVAGGAWPEKARKAALKIFGSDSPIMSIGTELLHDIKEVFDLKGGDRISTANLITELCRDDERPWKTYYRGFPLTPRQLSNKLKEYNILSKTIKTGHNETAKGYMLDQFKEAFSRYLSDLSSPGVTTTPASIDGPFVVTDRLSVTDENVTRNQKETCNRSVLAGGDVVTDTFPPSADRMEEGVAAPSDQLPDFAF